MQWGGGGGFSSTLRWVDYGQICIRWKAPKNLSWKAYLLFPKKDLVNIIYTFSALIDLFLPAFSPSCSWYIFRICKAFQICLLAQKTQVKFFFLGNLILVTVLNNAEKHPELFKKRFFWFVILGNITQKPFINRPTLPLSILLHFRLHRDLNYSDRHFLFTFH